MAAWRRAGRPTPQRALSVTCRLIYKDFEEGTGPLPVDGQEVVFNYTVSTWLGLGMGTLGHGARA